MATWDEKETATPSHRDHLVEMLRPVRSPSPYRDDRSGSWWAVPFALLAGAALVAIGVALIRATDDAGPVIGVAFLGWGLSFLTQYGTLAWYAVQVGRLRRRREQAALRGEPTPALTDFDVRQFHVPMRPTYSTTTGVFGLINPGDAPTPRLMEVAQVVGFISMVTMWGAAVIGVIASKVGG